MPTNNITFYNNFLEFLLNLLALWHTAILYIMQLRAVEVHVAFETDY